MAQNATLSAINATLQALTLSTQPVKEDKFESSHMSKSIILDPQVVEEFRRHIKLRDFDKLMEMVDDNKIPTQLILQVHDFLERHCMW